MNDMTLTKEEKQYKRLTEEPVARLILELGLPTTISMLITNLYNMVDTWFVSQLGTSATGAVGVVFGLMAIIQAFGFMFGHGAGSNISRLLGAHEKERAKAFSATGFYLAVGAGVLIAVIGIVDLNGLCRFAWKYGDHPSLCENLCFLYSGVGTGNGIQLCDEQCAPV